MNTKRERRQFIAIGRACRGELPSVIIFSFLLVHEVTFVGERSGKSPMQLPLIHERKDPKRYRSVTMVGKGQATEGSSIPYGIMMCPTCHILLFSNCAQLCNVTWLFYQEKIFLPHFSPLCLSIQVIGGKRSTNTCCFGQITLPQKKKKIPNKISPFKPLPDPLTLSPRLNKMQAEERNSTDLRPRRCRKSIDHGFLDGNFSTLASQPEYPTIGDQALMSS